MSNPRNIQNQRPSVRNQSSCPSQDAIIYAVIAAFQAAAIFITIELLIKFYLTFQRRNGLYFWSLVVAVCGCGISAFSFTLKYFVDDTPWQLYAAINMPGWWAMVTGQSVVLWSRLHLVLRDPFILRFLIAMIIIDALCLHVATSALTWGYFSPSSDSWASMYSQVEKAETTIFFVQETILSALYVRAALRLLSPTCGDRPRKVFRQLLFVNVMIITLNVVLLAMAYSNQWDIQANLKPFVYGLKLKMEFVVLNQLMVVSDSNRDHLFGPVGSVSGPSSSRNVNTLVSWGDIHSSKSVASADESSSAAGVLKHTPSFKTIEPLPEIGPTLRSRNSRTSGGIIMDIQVDRNVSNVSSVGLPTTSLPSIGGQSCPPMPPLPRSVLA